MNRTINTCILNEILKIMIAYIRSTRMLNLFSSGPKITVLNKAGFMFSVTYDLCNLTNDIMHV